MLETYDFHLTPTSRETFTSKRALDHWQPVIRSVEGLLYKIQYHALEEGVIDIACVPSFIFHSKPSMPYASAGPVEPTENGRRFYGHPGGLYEWIVCGRNANEVKFLANILPKNVDLSLYSHYVSAPDCCKSAMEKSILNGRFDLLRSSVEETFQDRDGIYDVEGYTLLNPIWRLLGIFAVPWQTCSITCEASNEKAKEILMAADELYPGISDTLHYLLEMPSSYDAWRGAVNIATPIVIGHSDTDAYKERAVIRWISKEPKYYPNWIVPDSAFGTEFPFVTRVFYRRSLLAIVGKNNA